MCVGSAKAEAGHYGDVKTSSDEVFVPRFAGIDDIESGSGAPPEKRPRKERGHEYGEEHQRAGEAQGADEDIGESCRIPFRLGDVDDDGRLRHEDLFPDLRRESELSESADGDAGCSLRLIRTRFLGPGGTGDVEVDPRQSAGELFQE